MSAITRPWGRLTLAGKIILPLFLILALTPVLLLVLWMTGILPAILDLLAQSGDPEDGQARERERLNSMLQATRQRGYAMQERVINPKAASISVPIRAGRQIHGCISLIYIASALTRNDVEKNLLPPLRAMTLKLARVLHGRELRSARLAAATA